jgi:hypothetical protein
MPTPLPTPKAEPLLTNPRKKGQGRAWWKKPLGLILLISLGVHVLLILFFGGTVLFKEKKSATVFQAERVTSEKSVEADSPNSEEAAYQEMTNDEAAPNEAGPPQEAVPAESVVKLSGESGWAPPVRGEGRVPIAGFSGKGKGLGRGKSELFGTVVGDKKLGVIVDVSGSMQRYLDRVMTEVLSNFPNAEVVLVEGCGMEAVTADSPSPAPKSRLAGRKKRPRREFQEPLIPPHVVGFNSNEGLASPAVGGLGGLRQSVPRVYESLLHRAATWIVVGDEANVATRLAFEHLAGDHVQAIYWFSDFEDPVEARESEKAAKSVQDNKIEVYLHPMGGLKNIRNWSQKVGAKVIEARVEKAM